MLTTKYHIDDTVEREKARLVVNGFMQMYGANYEETYALVSSYVMLRIFLSIVAVLDLNLMQLDMKNAFLQSKLDRMLYMNQPEYFNDGTGRLREISPVQKYLRLEIVRDRSVRKLWLHQQGYVDKLRRRFLDVEQNGRTRKTPVLVVAYATLTSDDKEAQLRQEEEFRQKVGSLRFAAATTRPDIAFTCSKLGSGLTVRSDQHWRKVDCCLAYLANIRDTALEFGGGAQSQSFERSRRFKSALGRGVPAEGRLAAIRATTMRPDITFACSKLGSGLTVRSDQHWRKVHCCLNYLVNTRDTALEFGGGAESQSFERSRRFRRALGGGVSAEGRLAAIRATTMRSDIAFACSKLGSGLTVRSDQHWREVHCCLTYLTNTRDTALEFGGGAEC
ncbi:unnamed protein product [Closterium sp. NIES-53]